VGAFTVEDIKRKWEDWYGDQVSEYVWNELPYQDREVMYVSGRALIDIDGCQYASEFVQVMGWVDSEEPLSEQEQREVRDLLRGFCASDNIAFWPR
jgi:hypothetical protein